jgi:hypothetical protein
MKRLLRAVLVAAAVMTVMAAQVGAAPDEDFVIGTGTHESGGYLFDVTIDAHADASGGDPSGTVTVTTLSIVVTTGPVTCLEVTDNTALLAFEGTVLGHVTLQVMDNDGTGSPDTISIDTSNPGGVGCVPGGGIEFPLVSGDFIVHDAVPLTSKGQCKEDGWRDFTDSEGHPFENQGLCVAFVEHTT